MQIFAQIVFQPVHKSIRRIRFNLIADLFMLLFPIIRKSDFKIIKLILFFTLWHRSHQSSVKFNYAFYINFATCSRNISKMKIKAISATVIVTECLRRFAHEKVLIKMFHQSSQSFMRRFTSIDQKQPAVKRKPRHARRAHFRIPQFWVSSR